METSECMIGKSVQSFAEGSVNLLMVMPDVQFSAEGLVNFFVEGSASAEGQKYPFGST